MGTKYSSEKIHFISKKKWEVTLKLIDYIGSQIVDPRACGVSPRSCEEVS